MHKPTINLVELRRSWARVRDCTVHQTNSIDANVMLELLDMIERDEATIKRVRHVLKMKSVDAELTGVGSEWIVVSVKDIEKALEG